MPQTAHTYEELRGVLIDILLGQEPVAYPLTQVGHIGIGIAEVLARRAGGANASSGQQPQLGTQDEELVRDVFWDLFRQGAITPGLNSANPNLPFFRLSHVGKKLLVGANPYRFHDTTSFISLLRREVPDVSDQAVLYCEEAVAAFYSDCHLASCVMLGVAAEAEFLRLLEAALRSATRSGSFASVPTAGFIRPKITAFQAALKPILSNLTPRGDFEDVDTNLSMIQSVLRIARNEAGHPSGKSPPSREQMYVYLQLFVPLAKQIMRLRQAL